jgi:hypothetical protein
METWQYPVLSVLELQNQETCMGGEMAQFKVFTNQEGKIEAVKQGIWWSLFFGPFIGFGIVFLLLCPANDLNIRAISHVILKPTMLAFLLVTFPLLVIMIAIIAYRQHKQVELHLLKNGYVMSGMITAKSKKSAEKLFSGEPRRGSGTN